MPSRRSVSPSRSGTTTLDQIVPSSTRSFSRASAFPLYCVVPARSTNSCPSRVRAQSSVLVNIRPKLVGPQVCPPPFFVRGFVFAGSGGLDWLATIIATDTFSHLSVESDSSCYIGRVPLHCGYREHPQNGLPAFGPRFAIRVAISPPQTGHVLAARNVGSEGAKVSSSLLSMPVCESSSWRRRRALRYAMGAGIRKRQANSKALTESPCAIPFTRTLCPARPGNIHLRKP